MTRQWLSPPEKMCLSHLLGEHAETHTFLSKMRKEYSLQGFRDGSMFFGAEYIQFRHDLLALFIKGHGTPLEITDDMIKKYPLIQPNEGDVISSVETLVNRCDDCAAKHGFKVTFK